MKFEVFYVKPKARDYRWGYLLPEPDTKLTGAVFPYTFGKYLDEQLDEAFITVVGSSVPPDELKIGTPIKIAVTDGSASGMNGISTNHYWLIADKTSVEYPMGSGRYKHELGLIELTKEAEGVIGQTLTFTNAKGGAYAFDDTWVVTR